jgi:hypothetical protein
VERTAGMKVLAVVGIIAITSLFVFTDIMKPDYITESKNTRFNQWVNYYSNCDGYTVVYYNYDVFKSESDIVIRLRDATMADEVSAMRQLDGFVTVYFDWEKDIIFFSGLGTDSTLQYCYYSNF